MTDAPAPLTDAEIAAYNRGRDDGYKAGHEDGLEIRSARFALCAADPRLFVRHLRAPDPVTVDGDPDFELSEGRATELLAEREAQAVKAALECRESHIAALLIALAEAVGALTSIKRGDQKWGRPCDPHCYRDIDALADAALAKIAAVTANEHQSKLVFAGKRPVDPRIVAKVRERSKFYDDMLKSLDAARPSGEREG